MSNIEAHTSCADSSVHQSESTENKEDEKSLPMMATTASYQTKFVYLNVGGKDFATTRDTIEMYPRGFLAAQLDFMDSQSQTNSKNVPIHVDRDPMLFYHILEFCRTGKLYMPDACTYDKMRDELDFWGLSDYILEADIKPLNIKNALYKKSMENTDKIVEEFVNTVIHSPYITEACEQGMFSIGIPMFIEKDDVLKHYCCSTYYEWINSIYTLAVTPDNNWTDLSHYIPKNLLNHQDNQGQGDQNNQGDQDQGNQDDQDQGDQDQDTFVEFTYNYLPWKKTDTFQNDVCDMLDLWRDVDEYLFNKIIHQIVELRNVFKTVSALNNAMNQLHIKEIQGIYDQYSTTMAYFLEKHETFSHSVYNKHCSHVLERYEPFLKVARLISYEYVNELVVKSFEKGNLSIDAVRPQYKGSIVGRVDTNRTVFTLSPTAQYSHIQRMSSNADSSPCQCINDLDLIVVHWDKERSFVDHWASKINDFLAKYPDLAKDGPWISMVIALIIFAFGAMYIMYKKSALKEVASMIKTV